LRSNDLLQKLEDEKIKRYEFELRALQVR